MPTSLQRVKQINSVEKNKPITFGEALNLICGTFSEQFLHETDAESLFEKVKRLPFDESLKQASEWGMIPPAAACRQDFDGTVTCKELLHMYVAAMGFTASASEQGPLPESCINILTERGLLEGVKIRSTNLPAETDDALKIAANCLPARNTVFAVPASMIEGELFNNNVFYSGENFTLAVRFERAVGEFGKVTVNYRIYDFDNCETERGRLDPEVVGKGITVYIEPSDRTVGWFRVEFDLYENGKQLPITYTANLRDSAGLPSADDGGFISYALVPKGTVIDKDSPFGYDCGLTTSPVLTPSQMVRVASMVGVSWLRDRLPYIFPHYFRERGVSDYTKLKAVADEVASKGLSLLTAFHTLPLWMTDSDPRSAGKKMSYNLFDIYNLAKETGENMKDSYSALEIWNEAEIGFFGGCPSDHLAAITKAYSLGYKKSGSKTKMMLNPFGRNPMRGRFGEILYLNGVTPYVDGANYHTYAPIDNRIFENVADVNLGLAEKYGTIHKEVYLTETGMPFSRNMKKKEFYDTVCRQVRYQTQSVIIGVSKGIKHIFQFYFRPYMENGTQWGMMRMDFTPFPGISNMAAMTSLLGKAKFIGKIPSEQVSVYLLDTGNGQAAVIWNNDPNTEITFNFPQGADSCRVYDAIGRKLDASDHIKLGILPVFVTDIDWKIYAVSTKADPISESEGLKNAQISEDIEKNVVLFSAIDPSHIKNERDKPQENWDGVITGWSPSGYSYKPGEALTFDLEVYNFGDGCASGEIVADVDDVFAIEPRSVKVAVDPMEVKRIGFTLKPSEKANEQSYLIRLKGIFNGRLVAPSVWQIIKDE